MLEDYENKEQGLRRERGLRAGRVGGGEGSDNELGEDENAEEEKKSAVLERKLTRFTDTDEDLSSFQVSGAEEKKEEPPKEKSLPWERTDIEKVFDFEKFKTENGIECVSN